MKHVLCRLEGGIQINTWHNIGNIIEIVYINGSISKNAIHTHLSYR